MPIDIAYIKETPNLVRESEKRRKPDNNTLVDTVLEYDAKIREINNEICQIRGKINRNSKSFSELKKKGENTESIAEETRCLKNNMLELEKQVESYNNERNLALNKIGNIVGHDVPTSYDEIDNTIIKIWGMSQNNEENLVPKLAHSELMIKLGILDAERGVRVMGHRGYFLKGIGLKLSMALSKYALDMLEAANYEMIQTPYLMNKDLMSKTAQLEEFDEALYKVSDGETEKYLIATSEQPLSAIHAGEWLEEKCLPIRYAGHSTCFRKEAGSGGKDQKGIFRVHQFEKVEQFCIVKPEDSLVEHERMLNISEQFYQSLGLPYRVINIVSGALNNAAAKKYDIEGWFPGQNDFRELVSCSNCTDYQSRALKVRCGFKKHDEKKKKYVHMLNCTMMANTRTICCILENYQEPTGIRIPEKLQAYVGTDFVEFKQ
jgi:seryl-tRNA synthetase